MQKGFGPFGPPKKKNLVVGLCGSAVATTALIVVLFVVDFESQERFIETLLWGAVASTFFYGVVFGGWKAGLAFAAVYAVLVLILLYAPPQYMLFLLLGHTVLCMAGLGYFYFGRRKKKEDDLVQQISNYEEQAKIDAMLRGGIYLVKINTWKPAIVHKVVSSGDNVYFSRVNGWGYAIEEKLAQNHDMTEEELLAHDDSFFLAKSDITAVDIDTKPRIWKVSFPHNGAVKITTDSPIEYLIHDINDGFHIRDFFELEVGCPVSIVEN